MSKRKLHDVNVDVVEPVPTVVEPVIEVETAQLAPLTGDRARIAELIELQSADQKIVDEAREAIERLRVIANSAAPFEVELAAIESEERAAYDRLISDQHAAVDLEGLSARRAEVMKGLAHTRGRAEAGKRAITETEARVREAITRMGAASNEIDHIVPNVILDAAAALADQVKAAGQVFLERFAVMSGARQWALNQARSRTMGGDLATAVLRRCELLGPVIAGAQGLPADVAEIDRASVAGWTDAALRLKSDPRASLDDAPLAAASDELTQDRIASIMRQREQALARAAA